MQAQRHKSAILHQFWLQKREMSLKASHMPWLKKFGLSHKKSEVKRGKFWVWVNIYIFMKTNCFFTLFILWFLCVDACSTYDDYGYDL